MKASLILIFIGCFGLNIQAQNLFDNGLVHKIEINFFDENWDYLLDSLASLGSETGSGTERILANVIINGTALDSCGVRYKGNSSMDTTSHKNPFNIDLNEIISGQEYQGKDKIKLANCFSDPSMLREALTYEIAGQYMNCPRASFVELYINGDYRGIYTNTESIDNEFLDDHYGSSDNPFFKCDPTSFEIFGDNSNLAYHADTMVYDTLYDMKSDYGLTELQALTYQLEFEPATINNYLDVDRALWFLALSSAFVHNDGYTAFGHNYYVYKMDNGKWSIVLWDVNMSFGGLLWNGSNILPLPLADLQEQDPFLHETAYDFRPLIAHLLSNPRFKRMYIAHFKTIMDENIENGLYLDRAEAMHDLIDPYVAVEPYPHYPYADFAVNVYDNVGTWINLRPGLETLMEARNEFISSLPSFNYTQPTISDITNSPESPDAYETVTIRATVESATLVQCAFRYEQFGAFEYIAMFDDGMHDDLAAGDGIYGVEIPVLSSDIHYYIYAENEDAGKFSPVRAAHEYYTISVNKGLVINEISALNTSIAFDENGDYDDWIELYNNSTETIHLLDYHLSDDMAQLDKWTFPDVSIEPDEYLIIWADDEPSDSDELHANFKLSGDGESLILTNNSLEIVDIVSFGTQYENITYGRFENGIGDFDYLIPTFNGINETLASTNEFTSSNSFNVYPNPTSNYINIDFNENYNGEIFFYNINGKLMQVVLVSDQKIVQLSLEKFPQGTYLIRDENHHIVRIIKI